MTMMISASGTCPAPENNASDPAHATDPGTFKPCRLADAIRAGDTLAAAMEYSRIGISTFAVALDRQKKPAYSGWRTYAEERLATRDELHSWHERRYPLGIGACGGPLSGNLAVLDIETWDALTRWSAKLSDELRASLVRCPVIRTPKGGAHLWCRLVESQPGMKLAKTAEGVTLIEIRGSQHYVVCAGSPAQCHELNKPYRLLRPGWLDGEPFEQMQLETWADLCFAAAELNEYHKPAAREVVGDRRESSGNVGERPGDHFNSRVSWGDILEPHGWRVFRTSGNTTYWNRPGKKPAGISASTGFCSGESGNPLLYVFSTSASPFEAETSYSKFATYALLNHHGNFSDATRALGQAGYGVPLKRAKVVWKGGRR